MGLKIGLPNKIAICLFANDKDTVDKQVSILDVLRDTFEIEYWFRSERNADMYQSFSQMINDAIDDTDSEFMVFINPKSEIILSDIHLIINNLCSGYAAVYTTSFGVHGATKELFRRVGLFDERFLHSELEDDDMMIRLGMFDKAIFYDTRPEKYEKKLSYRDPLRGLASTIFENKWYRDEKDIYHLNPEYQNVKQISKRHRNSNTAIYESWMDSSKAVVLMRDDKSNKYFRVSRELNKFNKEKIVFGDLIFNVKVADKKCWVEFKSNEKTLVHAHFVESYPSRKMLRGFTILANNWIMLDLNDRDFDFTELRIYHDDNMVYHNTLNLNSESQNSLNLYLPIKIRV